MVDAIALLLSFDRQLAILLLPLVFPATTPPVAGISDALLPWSGQGHENTYHPHDVNCELHLRYAYFKSISNKMRFGK